MKDSDLRQKFNHSVSRCVGPEITVIYIQRPELGEMPDLFTLISWIVICKGLSSPLPTTSMTLPPFAQQSAAKRPKIHRVLFPLNSSIQGKIIRNTTKSKFLQIEPRASGTVVGLPVEPAENTSAVLTISSDRLHQRRKTRGGILYKSPILRRVLVVVNHYISLLSSIVGVQSYCPPSPPSNFKS